MGLISQEDVKKIIAPHVCALRAIPLDAWDQYHSQTPDGLLVAYGPRTRASSVNDLMLKNAAEYAATNRDSIRVFERQQMIGITINGTLAIRFKKLDEDSQSRNQPSQQVEDYRGQRSLDGIDAIHNLELGYVLSDQETEILEIRVVHPSGRGVAWWFCLNEEDEVSGAIELFTPSTELEPQPPKIVPKTTDNVVPIRKKQDEN